MKCKLAPLTILCHSSILIQDLRDDCQSAEHVCLEMILLCLHLARTTSAQVGSSGWQPVVVKQKPPWTCVSEQERIGTACKYTHVLLKPVFYVTPGPP